MLSSFWLASSLFSLNSVFASFSLLDTSPFTLLESFAASAVPLSKLMIQD